MIVKQNDFHNTKTTIEVEKELDNQTNDEATDDDNIIITMFNNNYSQNTS